jgi:hypothetical protein
MQQENLLPRNNGTEFLSTKTLDELPHKAIILPLNVEIFREYHQLCTEMNEEYEMEKQIIHERGIPKKTR